MSVVLRLSGPLSREAVVRTAAEFEHLLRTEARVVVELHSCDLSVVDAVARLQLVACRYGRAIEVVGADPGLFEVCGLADLL